MDIRKKYKIGIVLGFVSGPIILCLLPWISARAGGHVGTFFFLIGMGAIAGAYGATIDLRDLQEEGEGPV